MLEKYIRPLYQSIFLNPVAQLLSRIFRFSPTLITVTGCILGLVAASFVALHAKWLGVIFLLLSGFCDTLDGTLARLGKKCSDFGTMLDIVSDRIVESAIIVGLYLAYPQSRGLICLLMLASVLICITSFLVIGIFSENKSEKNFHYSPGLIERPEAFVFFILMVLFPPLFHLLGWAFIALVLLTVTIRLSQFSTQQLR